MLSLQLEGTSGTTGVSLLRTMSGNGWCLSKKVLLLFFLLSRKTVTEFTNLTAGFICLFVLNVSLITVEKLKGTEGEWLVGKHV